MGEQVKWGDIILVVNSIDEDVWDQNVARMTQTVEGQRDSQAGLVKAVFSTFHSGGLRPQLNDMGSWLRDMDKFFHNEGLITHIPGGLFLPYLLQVQESITSGEDIGDHTAANRRVHSANTSVGSTVMRWYAALGGKFFQEVSTSDHSLQVTDGPAVEAGFTFEEYTAMRELRFSAGRRLCVALRQTNPGLGNTAAPVFHATANPDDNPPTWVASGTQTISNNAYIACFGMERFASIADGFNLFYWADATGDAGDASLSYLNFADDFTTVDLTTQPVLDNVTGSSLTVATGGYMIGAPPWEPESCFLVVPVISNPDGISQPRKLLKLELTVASGALTVLRATGSYPNTELENVTHAFPFLGGMCVIGNPALDRVDGTEVRLIGSDGNVRDMGWPGLNGSTVVYIRHGFASGRYAIFHGVYSDGSDAGDWLWEPAGGTWHMLSPLYEQSGTYIEATVPYAEAQVSSRLRRRYAFVPNGSNTDVYRQFQPYNVADHPIHKNTAELKQPGPLIMYSLTMDMGGPIEANKSIVAQQYLGRFLSPVASTYGTLVSTVIGITGDTVTNPLFTANTFDSAFESYNVPGSGKAFQALAMIFTVDNDGTLVSPTAKTPSALPLMNTFIVKWPKLSQFSLELDLQETLRAGQYGHWTALTNALKALESVPGGGKPTQRLLLGDYDIPATLESYHIRAKPSGIGRFFTTPVNQPRIVFRQAPGTTA